MAYAPQFDFGRWGDEIPRSLLARLAEVLAVVQGPRFDRMPGFNRCSAILSLVHILTAIDKIHLAHHPETPTLYSSGVRYRTQQTANGANTGGVDLWWTMPVVLEHGEGSCEDLAAWRIAELQLHGQTPYDRSARPRVHSKDGGPGYPCIYHVVLYYPSTGIEEDPSYLLGMRPAWTN